MDSTLKRTWAEIDLDALVHNYHMLRKKIGPEVKFLGVVKADAYGHGSVQVSRLLQELGADYLAVSSIDEAIELRHNDITMPILILGHTPKEQVSRLIKYNITQAVTCKAKALEYSEEAVRCGGTLKIHIKVDTGMSRLGYLCDGDYVHSWNMIPEIIEAFRTRSLLEKVYPNQFNLDPINVKADFSDRKGEFVCYLGGHIHCNAYFDVTGLENESTELVPQKMILCTNQAPSEKGVVYNRVIREEDSLSSNSFCIYAVDTKEKKIYITYFGAYKPSNDRNYPEIHTISYN